MKRQVVMALLAASLFAVPVVARADGKCGAHQHESVEKDADEGGTVHRCVCDDGWNAKGPTAPCKKVKGGKAAKPATNDGE